MKLVLKNPGSNHMGDYFSGSLQFLTEGELNNLGYKDMEYVVTLYSSNSSLVGHVFKKNDLYGAFNVEGKIYAEFEYIAFDSITKYGRLKLNSLDVENADMFWFKCQDNTYDVYCGSCLYFSKIVSKPYLLEDALTKEYRYCILEYNSGYEVYDMETNKSFSCPSREMLSICGKHEQIMYFNELSNEMVIRDFSGLNEISCDRTEDEIFYFTDIENWFIVHNDVLESEIIIAFKNGKFQKVLGNYCYTEILHVFRDMVIGSYDFNELQIAKIEPPMNQFDSYSHDVICTIPNGIDYKRMDFDEGIILMNNGYKILLSHYLQNQNNYEPFLCDDIIHVGRGVFQCFQYDKINDCEDITFIHYGQSVNYKYIREAFYAVDTCNFKRIFNAKGLIMHNDLANAISNMSAKEQEHYYDYMTKKKQNGELVILLESITGNDSDYCFNVITGVTYEAEIEAEMVWHNLIRIDDLLYNVIDDTLVYFWNDITILAKYNDYLVVKHNNSVYISSDSFQIIEVKNAEYFVDSLNTYTVVRDNDTAYFISNNGMETYCYLSDVHGYPVYKSVGFLYYYIVGFNKINKNEIAYEVANGMASTDFNVLL